MSQAVSAPKLTNGKPISRSALSIAYHDIAFKSFAWILIPKIILFIWLSYRGSVSWIQFLVSFPPTFGVVLVLMSFSLYMKNNILKLSYLFSLDFFLSVLFFAQSLYFKYFGDFASFYQLGEMKMLGPVFHAIMAIAGMEVLFFADLPLWPFLIKLLKRRNSYSQPGWIKGSVFFLLAGLVLNTLALHRIHNDSTQLESVFSRKETVRLTGLPTYEISDAWNYLIAEKERHSVSRADIEKTEDWFRQRRGESGNEFTGLGKGFNLIVIQVESLQNFVIGRKLNGREVTPNLNRLAEKGIYFSRIYDQTGAGNTSDATFLANCSLYPSERGPVAFLYPKDSFQCLPHILGKYGYTTATMHAYDKAYWNRETFQKTEGFEHQFYRDQYLMTDSLGWGLSDRAFFKQSLTKIKSLHKPFFAYVTTLTSHTPFDDVTAAIDNFPLGNLEGELIGNYIRAINYVDGAIGEFLQNLSENNLASNTIIVIFGDHRARFEKSDLRKIGVSDMAEIKKIPLIIAFPGKGLKSKVIGGLIDVAPTVSNILGVDTSDGFFMGKDLLRNGGTGEGGFVVFRDGSYISRKNSLDGAAASRRLMISDMIEEKDLIPLLKSDPEAAGG
jgi:lipoteichoic acid synthase